MDVHGGKSAAVEWTIKGGGCDDGGGWVLQELWGSGKASAGGSGAIWPE